MRITKVFTRSVVAQMFYTHTLSHSRILARHHLHVAQLARPSGRTAALVCIFSLVARGSVLAWRLLAPVDELVALLACIAVCTMT